MDWIHLALVSLILFGASVLQGAVGFAYSLLATPLLAWTGLALSEIVAIVSVSGLVQVLVATIQLRREVRWRSVILATGLRYVTIPLGIGLLLAVDTMGRAEMRQLIGSLVLAALLLQIFGRVQPRPRLHRGWAVLAFTSSGVMQGMAAMGGPPAVLWVMAHQWTSQQSRAFLLALFLLGGPPQLLLLYLAAQHDLSSAMLSGLLATPLVALGTTAGVRLGNLIEKDRLRQIAFGILFVTAAISVLSPLFG